jgi:hypothetical protein
MVRVRLYKVLMPSLLAWPPGSVILYVCYTRENADIYIASHPNPFLRPFLKVEESEVDVMETD